MATGILLRRWGRDFSPRPWILPPPGGSVLTRCPRHLTTFNTQEHNRQAAAHIL